MPVTSGPPRLECCRHNGFDIQLSLVQDDVMTRINVIPPRLLYSKHLLAEYRELPRIFDAARVVLVNEWVPTYRMGTGHVKFFYNKLQFLVRRQQSLIDEMIKRGYSPQFTDPANKLTDNHRARGLVNDWYPSRDDVVVNMGRLREREPDFYNRISIDDCMKTS